MLSLRRGEAKKSRRFETSDALRREAGDRLTELARLQMDGDFEVRKGRVSLEGYGVYLEIGDVVDDFTLPFPKFEFEASSSGLNNHIKWYTGHNVNWKSRTEQAQYYMEERRREFERRFPDWEAGVKRWIGDMKRVAEAVAIFNRDQILLVQFVREQGAYSPVPYGSIH